VIRAVLFDLDGTLYCQAPLRAAMAVELSSVPAWRGPAVARRTWHILRTFRRTREQLRAASNRTAALEELQYTAAAEKCGVDPDVVRGVVDEWMFRRPLRYLPAVRRRGSREALSGLRAQGVLVGVFSDYPTRAKLCALGLDALVSLQLCATDSEIDAFKPQPRGFLAACERWGIAPDRVAYVGDRPEVDAAGASAAGMACLIVGARRETGPFRFTPLPALRLLSDTLPLGTASTAAASPAFLTKRD
jgi:FMN phosphatase YigB (HAD superfamily)